jgi:hypothetical protein
VKSIGDPSQRAARGGRIAAALAIALAAIAAVAPLPPAWVERVFSQGWYPRLQPPVTAVSRVSPIALFDVAVGLLLAVAAVTIARRWRAEGFLPAIRSAAMRGVIVAAVVYLWFLIFWGFNYRRVPLEHKLAYDATRVTREQGVELAQTAVERANANVEQAKAAPFDAAALAGALGSVQSALGGTPLSSAPQPKRSLLSWYFRRAAIDGMTDPFFLEIVINPDLLPSERPFVLAHEWAHLAGYADESEANFVAWLTCVRASPAAQYSGWLAAYQHIASGLPVADRRALAAALSPPVRADLNAQRERFSRSSPAVRAAARGAYDTYLRANRIEEGIANYNAVVRLMLGVPLDAAGNPRLR